MGTLTNLLTFRLYRMYGIKGLSGGLGCFGVLPSPCSNYTNKHTSIIITCGQSNLTKGRIDTTTHERYCLYFTMDHPFPLKMGDLEPDLIYGSLGPFESTTQTTSLSVQPFCRANDRDRHANNPVAFYGSTAPPVPNAAALRSLYAAAPPVQSEYPADRRTAAAVPLPESP